MMFHDNKPLSILHDKSINPKFDHYLHLHANLIDVKKQKKTAIKELKKKIMYHSISIGIRCDMRCEANQPNNRRCRHSASLANTQGK